MVEGILKAKDNTIDGEGIIVEIDESKFGKRKSHRGHRVEGAWMVRGIERTRQKKVFLEDKSPGILLKVLNEHAWVEMYYGPPLNLMQIIQIQIKISQGFPSAGTQRMQ